MKKFILILLSFVLSSTANALPSMNDDVAAKLIVGQIVKRQLLTGESSNLNAYLQKILAGKGFVAVTNLTCDAMLGGQDFCELQITSYSETETADENIFSFKIQVTISRDGEVTSASAVDSAGSR